MCGYICTGFIDFMLKGKRMLDYTNLFPPNKYDKNNKIITKYFQQLETKNFFYVDPNKDDDWKNILY